MLYSIEYMLQFFVYQLPGGYKSGLQAAGTVRKHCGLATVKKTFVEMFLNSN